MILRAKYTDGDLVAGLDDMLSQVEEVLKGGAGLGTLRDLIWRRFDGKIPPREYEPFDEWLCEIAPL